MGSLAALLLTGLPLFVALIHPRVLFYMVLATGAIPISLEDSSITLGPVGQVSLSSLRLLGIILALVVIVLPAVNNLFSRLRPYWAHLLFLLFCLLTLSWAPSFTYGLRMFAKLSAPLVFVLAIETFVNDESQLRRLSNLMIGSGLFVLGLAIVTKVLGVNPGAQLTVPGMSPAVFSAHLLVGFSVALVRIRWERQWLSILWVGLFGTAIVASFTRITIAGLFAVGAVIVFLGTRGLTRAMLPVAMLLGLPTLFLLNEKFRTRMFIGGETLSSDDVLNDPGEALQHVHGSGRFAAWDQVLSQFFYTHPLQGSGLGATQEFYYTHSATGLGVIHSEVVRLLAEVGIIGFGLFLLMIVVYVLRLLKQYFTRSDGGTKSYTISALAALSSYVVFMLTDNGIDYVNSFGFYVFALIGMSAVEYRLMEAARNRVEEPVVDSQPISSLGQQASPCQFRLLLSITGEHRFPLLSRGVRVKR